MCDVFQEQTNEIDQARIAAMAGSCLHKLSVGARCLRHKLPFMEPFLNGHFVCGTERKLHTSPPQMRFLDARDEDHHEKERKTMVKHTMQYFDEVEKKKLDKETFQAAVAKYLEHQSVHRRGLVEFINASLNKMEEYGVHRDLDMYKCILNLFPKGRFPAKTTWQRELMHYPKQQQCGIDLLDQMEYHG